jgi:hypothetical protein
MAYQALLAALERTEEVTITVRGRRSGRDISLPVWFVLDREPPRLWLLPIRGSRSPWFRNLEAHPVLRLQAGGASAQGRAHIRRDEESVQQAIQRFKERYTAREFERYYRGVDVTVEVPLSGGSQT